LIYKMKNKILTYAIYDIQTEQAGFLG
jgi:hypothetical protein